MDKSKLNEYLYEKILDIEQDAIHNVQFKVTNLKLLKLRDILMVAGTIYVEDIDNKIYIASLKGGFLNKNTAVVAFCLDGDYLQTAIYAKEGLIKQHTYEDIVNEINRLFKEYIEK